MTTQSESNLDKQISEVICFQCLSLTGITAKGHPAVSYGRAFFGGWGQFLTVIFYRFGRINYL